MVTFLGFYPFFGSGALRLFPFHILVSWCVYFSLYVILVASMIRWIPELILDNWWLSPNGTQPVFQYQVARR